MSMNKLSKGQFVYITKDFNSVKRFEVGIVEEVKCAFATVKFMGSQTRVKCNILRSFDIDKTGDSFDKKVCNRCFRLLPIENFQKNQNGKNNRTIRRPSCNDCRTKIDGKQVSSKDKKEWEKKKPNKIIWECPICHKKSIPGLNSKVVLDHDHITGKPRGWICDSCNTGLGRFDDNVDTLKEVIKYLKKFNGEK